MNGLLERTEKIIVKWGDTVNESVKKVLAVILFAAIFTGTIGIPLFKEDSFSIVVMLGAAATCALIILFVSRESFQVRKFKSNEDVLLIVMGMCFLINALYYKVIGYFAIAVIFAGIIPALHRALAPVEKKKIFAYLCTAIVAVFGIFVIISIIAGPGISEKQYSSFLGNPNILGGFTVITVPASIYLMIKKKDGNPWIVLGLEFILGIAVSMCFMSNSRTSFIAIITQLIVCTVVLTIREARRNSNWAIICIKKGVAVALIIVLSFLMIFMILTVAKQGDSPSIFESISLSGSRLEKGLGDNENDAFTSGRMGIWKEYIDNLSFIGHASESRDIQNGVRSYINTNAHNAYIQVAYSAGIIAGIVLAIYVVIVGIKLMKKGMGFLRGKDLSDDMLLFIMAFLGFFFASLTSAGYMIFTYLPATLFWISESALAEKKDESCEKSFSNRKC